MQIAHWPPDSATPRMKRRFSPIHLGGFFCLGAMLGSTLATFFAPFFARFQSIGSISIFLRCIAAAITCGALPYILGSYLSPDRRRIGSRVAACIALLAGSIFAPGTLFVVDHFSATGELLWLFFPFAVALVTPFFAASLSRRVEEET